MTSWWAASLLINRALCGSASEPLCSRVYRQPPSRWRAVFMFCADIALQEENHCYRVHSQWQKNCKNIVDKV